MKLVTIDPRRIELADYGVLHLAPRPGTNAARDARHRPRHPPRRAHRRRTSSTARTEGYDALLELLAAVHARGVEEITGVPAADLEQPPHIYGEADNACFLWGLGVTEHKYGSEVVQLICNVALMTGNVGRAGLGAAAAARPEQRPGLLRHGRAAGHLHRLPLGRRRGGDRAALRGRAGA